MNLPGLPKFIIKERGVAFSTFRFNRSLFVLLWADNSPELFSSSRTALSPAKAEPNNQAAACGEQKTELD